MDADFFGSWNWYGYGAEPDRRRILIVEYHVYT